MLRDKHNVSMATSEQLFYHQNVLFSANLNLLQAIYVKRQT